MVRVRVIAHTYHAYHAAATPEELYLEAWTAGSVFGCTRNRYRPGAGQVLPLDAPTATQAAPYPTSTPSPRRRQKTRISQKRFNTPRRKRTESLQTVQVRRRRRLLRRLALLGLHALPVLLGNAGGDVGLDVDDR